MGLALYHISYKCENTTSKVRHFTISLKAPNQSLQLENTKSLSKKLIESSHRTQSDTP